MKTFTTSTEASDVLQWKHVTKALRVLFNAMYCFQGWHWNPPSSQGFTAGKKFWNPCGMVETKGQRNKQSYNPHFVWVRFGRSELFETIDRQILDTTDGGTFNTTEGQTLSNANDTQQHRQTDRQTTPTQDIQKHSTLAQIAETRDISTPLQTTTLWGNDSASQSTPLQTNRQADRKTDRQRQLQYLFLA